MALRRLPGVVRLAVWIASYTDILFAVNRGYHPGEKRLLTYLADLPSRPHGALEDPTKLCTLASSLSSPIIEHIATMLKRLDEWLNRDPHRSQIFHRGG